MLRFVFTQTSFLNSVGFLYPVVFLYVCTGFGIVFLLKESFITSVSAFFLSPLRFLKVLCPMKIEFPLSAVHCCRNSNGTGGEFVRREIFF